MGIVSQLLAPRYAARNAIDDYWYTPLGQTAASGARVTAETAMTLSAVWACFPAGTLVRKSDSQVVSIESIAVGDLVPTHTGELHRVTEVVQLRYSGLLYTLRRSAGQPITATEDHLFYVARRPPWSKWYGNPCSGRHPEKLIYEWMTAKDIRKGDFLVEPVSTAIDVPADQLVMVRHRNLEKHNGSAPVYEDAQWRLPVTPALMRLSGYFLSEGFFNGRAIEFAFHENETDYHADIAALAQEVFAANVKMRPGNGHGVTLSMPSTKAVAFFRQFGHRACKKVLPQWVMTLPLNLQAELVKGFWRGDGFRRPEGFCIDTSSRQLAEQLRVICLRLGVIPSFMVSTQDVILPVTGRQISRTIYRLTCTGLHGVRLAAILDTDCPGDAMKCFAFIANGYAHYGVRGVDVEATEGLDVYNLEVEGDHSYIAEGVASHNCVNLISRNVASLPLVTYRYVGDEGRARARNHPLYTLLHDRPNRLQTPYEFKQFLQVSLLLRGNAYAVPIPSQTSPIDELIPLHPDRVREEQYDTGRRGPSGLIVPGTRYRYRQPSGQEIVLSDDDVIHLKGLSLDGIRGVSIIEYARETFGLAAAEREYAARFFGSGSQARGVLRVKGQLSPGAVARLKADWELMHQGLANAHRVAVLEEGVEFQPISLSPEDSQFLESRAHERGEIASWFSVPPHMIGDTDKSSSWGTGIQQQQVAFLVFTLRPWLKVWEEAIKRDLILQPNTFFVQFIVEELLRGDLETRYRAYSQGRQWGWLSVNEIRRMENMDPIPNGDIYLQASNMIEAGQVAAESSDKETWTLNERRIADGLEPIPGGDAVYMPSSMIPAIELEESEEGEEEAESEMEGMA